MQNQELKPVEHYSIELLFINGVKQDHLSQNYLPVEEICKGGFRFYSNIDLELEDRLLVQLHFPDDRAQQVLGRICYSDSIDDDITAYGFSIIDGFYPLGASSR
jgi:hypothetical protein